MVYLGLKINAVGLQPVEEKINAVKKASAPRNVSELRSFLGMVQHYHSFLPGLTTTLAPLHKRLGFLFRGIGQRNVKQLSRAVRKVLLVIHY